MATNSPRLDMSRFDDGESWDHTDLVNLVDEYAIERDVVANRPASGDYADELFYATDEGVLYRWDDGSSTWVDEISGGVASSTVGSIEAQASEPSSPSEGDIWVDTS